jgi:colanic acid/amylovoran biosynthesis glycosyltransferase
MGIDSARFKFTPREPPNHGPLRLVTVARLVEKKGVDYAIRAVARLAAAGVDVEYTVVGDGPLREKLTQLTEALGLSGRVKLVGSMAHSDIAALLQRSHVMLAPSVTASDGDMEGLPVAIMEAMASGLPVVSTVHSGIPELIDDDVNGYLVPEKDVTALAAKLEHVALHTADWKRVAEAAHRTVVERHDIHTLNDQLASLLGSLA